MRLGEIYELYKQHPKISTDTRKIENGSIFLALKGDKFNGNAFANQAIEAGAAYAIIDEPTYKKDHRYLVVDNVLSTLQELATFHRDQLNIPIIGITGTNGKTTSKELIHAVLAEKFKTFATIGNLNNHIGVPLSVLSINTETEMAVIEMGANHLHEIEFLCSIARPDYGLITNVGKAHLEGFGSYEGVKKAKSELYKWLSAHNGVLFLQKDNPELTEMANAFSFKKVINYGFCPDNDIYGELEANDPFLSLKWMHGNENSVVETRLTGAYNAENLLAAIAIGNYFNLTKEEINHGIENYRPENNRSQVLTTENNTIICDYYNANASSMKAALENMQSIKSALKKTVILGDMFELGTESAYEHKKLVEQALRLENTNCIFIGKEFYAHKSDKAVFWKTTEEALETFKINPPKHQLILLKASRGMAFEKIASVL